MSKSLQSAVRGALVKCVDLAHESADTTQPAIDVRGLMRAAVEMARDAETGQSIKHSTVAAAAGYKPDYWSRVLAGERGIELQALGALPLEVQREFLSLWSRALGGRFVDQNSQAEKLAQLAQAAIQALQGGEL